MNRPLHIWVLFAGCLVVLLAGLTWVSWTALRLDREHAEAQQKADFEEKVRLALWRMDSTLAPLIVQESSRPYFTYNSFYAAERAYGRMLGPPSKGELLVPSPLLTQTSSNVLLHFQYGPDGRLTSPQVPEENQRHLVESTAVSADQLALARARFADLRALFQRTDLATACANTLSEPVALAGLGAGPQMPMNSQPNAQVGNSYFAQAAQVEQQQYAKNNAELQARAQSTMQALNWNGKLVNPPGLPSGVAEGIVKPIWIGETLQSPEPPARSSSYLTWRSSTSDHSSSYTPFRSSPPPAPAPSRNDALVLARRVSVDGQNYIQGCWLDWPAIRKSLLQSVQDLLPNADLIPVRGASTDPQARLLASIPLKLTVPQPRQAVAAMFLTPVKLSLAFAWACVLIAGGAVGCLLYGTVALSERRAAFVSAVTHELRTPLTTFKMYSEMLAAGMVRDEEKQRSYLDTLCSEANRLTHLVENVLAYARLERGSARTRVERIAIADLLERVQGRLRQRAEQAGMKIVVDSDTAALKTPVYVDVSVVEQILFNLVDNACKYAVPNATGTATNGHEHLIHLEALPDNKTVILRVRDHGQGISAEAARRLFRPFSKSAVEAAHSAPGVGLGLALCRRLSRTMGGDLRFDARVTDGACFVLQLPVHVAAV